MCGCAAVWYDARCRRTALHHPRDFVFVSASELIGFEPRLLCCWSVWALVFVAELFKGRSHALQRCIKGRGRGAFRTVFLVVRAPQPPSTRALAEIRFSLRCLATKAVTSFSVLFSCVLHPVGRPPAGVR